MSFEIWLAYALATVVIQVIPGPTIILVISQAVAHGRRSVVPLVIGVVCGDFTAMTLSLLGLGAVMSASAALFALFKWVGALYLLYLGIRLWRPGPEDRFAPQKCDNSASLALSKRAFIVTALNPKGIAFFVAFLPQFVHPGNPVLQQLLILGGTFLGFAVVVVTLYALFASQLRESIKKTRVRRWLDRCGGTALIGAGIFTAGMQRTA